MIQTYALEIVGTSCCLFGWSFPAESRLYPTPPPRARIGQRARSSRKRKLDIEGAKELAVAVMQLHIWGHQRSLLRSIGQVRDLLSPNY